jgi:hypothetical protein
MRISRILRLVVFVGTVTSVLLAADISGKWAGKGEQRPEWVPNFKADGSKVTGTTQGADGKQRSINDGKLEGGTLSFSVNSGWQWVWRTTANCDPLSVCPQQ